MAPCKVCQTEVKPFLSFGNLPLGNAFLSESQLNNERQYPLTLAFCDNCTLVQQIEPPPENTLADDYKNYHYVPYGDTLRNHYAGLGKKIIENLRVDSRSLVVDIGSNDGTLLSTIKRHSHARVLGVEPAIEISRMAREAGIPTITSFFTREVAERLVAEVGKADIVTCTQTLQHIPDILEFVKNIRFILKPNGAFIFEGRYFADTIKKLSFDTVYHEMMYFFTLNSLSRLLRRENFEIFSAEVVDIYGGSLRSYAKLIGNPEKLDMFPLTKEILKDENDLRLDKYQTYQDFGNKVLVMRTNLHDLITRIKRNSSIAGYGAPSTSATLLNFCQLGKESIDYIVDDSPLKQGLLAPGTHIPIVSSETLAKKTPDYLLVLAWRLKDDILPKVKQFREAGMKVIIPLPEVQVL